MGRGGATNKNTITPRQPRGHPDYSRLVGMHNGAMGFVHVCVRACVCVSAIKKNGWNKAIKLNSAKISFSFSFIVYQ